MNHIRSGSLEIPPPKLVKTLSPNASTNYATISIFKRKSHFLDTLSLMRSIKPGTKSKSITATPRILRLTDISKNSLNFERSSLQQVALNLTKSKIILTRPKSIDYSCFVDKSVVTQNQRLSGGVRQNRPPNNQRTLEMENLIHRDDIYMRKFIGGQKRRRKNLQKKIKEYLPGGREVLADIGSTFPSLCQLNIKMRRNHAHSQIGKIEKELQEFNEEKNVRKKLKYHQSLQDYKVFIRGVLDNKDVPDNFIGEMFMHKKTEQKTLDKDPKIKEESVHIVDLLPKSPHRSSFSMLFKTSKFLGLEINAKQINKRKESMRLLKKHRK